MNLEDKIKQLNGQFDFEEPAIGHFNRFETRLKQQHKKTKKQSSKKWMLIASVFILCVTIGATIIKNNATGSTPEFQQTETYFSQVIKDELKKVEAQKNTQNQQIIDDAFLQMEKLETDYKNLQKDLANTQNKKQIIFAMLENYRQRILILQNLLNTLDRYKQLKNTHYEVQNI